jgi:hypothetical protein
MRRRWLLLAMIVAAAATGVGSATTAPAERLTIPYLSGGAGVYLDGDGRPVTSEGAPRVPGIHLRPPVAAPVPKPEPEPVPVPPPVPAPQPTPQPSPTPIPIPAPPEGYYRPELVAAVAVSQVTTVFCRTDAAWPANLAGATGYWRWGGSEITMRTWRCEGIAQEKIGTEAFARGLFVLAHEAAHAVGFRDECDADKRALATMGDISARLGWGYAVGEAAGRQLNELLRPNPPPDPYCIGRLP